MVWGSHAKLLRWIAVENCCGGRRASTSTVLYLRRHHQTKYAFGAWHQNKSAVAYSVVVETIRRLVANPKSNLLSRSKIDSCLAISQCWNIYPFYPWLKSLRSLSVLMNIQDSPYLWFETSTIKIMRSIARILISIVFFSYPNDLYNDHPLSLSFIQ